MRAARRLRRPLTRNVGRGMLMRNKERGSVSWFIIPRTPSSLVFPRNDATQDNGATPSFRVSRCTCPTFHVPRQLAARGRGAFLVLRPSSSLVHNGFKSFRPKNQRCQFHLQHAFRPPPFFLHYSRPAHRQQTGHKHLNVYSTTACTAKIRGTAFALGWGTTDPPRRSPDTANPS